MPSAPHARLHPEQFRGLFMRPLYSPQGYCEFMTEREHELTDLHAIAAEQARQGKILDEIAKFLPALRRAAAMFDGGKLGWMRGGHGR